MDGQHKALFKIYYQNSISELVLRVYSEIHTDLITHGSEIM